MFFTWTVLNLPWIKATAKFKCEWKYTQPYVKAGGNDSNFLSCHAMTAVYISHTSVHIDPSPCKKGMIIYILYTRKPNRGSLPSEVTHWESGKAWKGTQESLTSQSMFFFTCYASLLDSFHTNNYVHS